jgi:hypothetical protein
LKAQEIKQKIAAEMKKIEEEANLQKAAELEEENATPGKYVASIKITEILVSHIFPT